MIRVRLGDARTLVSKGAFTGIFLNDGSQILDADEYLSIMRVPRYVRELDTAGMPPHKLAKKIRVTQEPRDEIISYLLIDDPKRVQKMIMRAGFSRGVAAYAVNRLYTKAKIRYSIKDVKKINRIITQTTADCRNISELASVIFEKLPGIITANHIELFVVPFLKKEAAERWRN